MNSRQRLRLCEVESPGGKKAGLKQEPLDQKGRQQLALDEGTRRHVGSFGDATQTQKRLEPLETELDLPVLMHRYR